MNNGIRNLTLGFAVLAGLSIFSGSSFAQLNSNTLEKRLAALEKITQEQQTRIQALEAKLKYVTVNGTDMMITGANLHLRNGAGSINQLNGLGNLTIGYDDNTGFNERTGSHNLLIGRYLGYTGYGSILTGEENSTTGNYSSILSGYRSRVKEGCDYSGLMAATNSSVSRSCSAIIAASNSDVNANFSGILGGEANTVDGHFSSIVGGKQNKVWFTASYGSVMGGFNNAIFKGTYNTISGGYGNEVYGFLSAISGGSNGLIEVNVTAGSISGGDQNTIHNNYSSIGGGHNLATTTNMQFKGGGLTG